MTFKTFLIPTDGSDPAEAAARRGLDLTAQCNANAHILSVADSSIAAGAGYSGNSQSIRQHLRELARDRAASLRDDAIEQGIPDATAAVRDGIPAKQIVAYAEEQDVDAIAIGTSGRGNVGRAIVGSVADKVVRTAPVPVVTINARATTTGSVDSLLLPTDGSEKATEAARVGFDLADQLAATVHLLSVVENDHSGWLPKLSADTGGFDTSVREAAYDAVEALATEARDRDLDVQTTVTEGTSAAGITDYVDAEGIDLIAMGTAGRGGFDRLLVGSVTDEVVRTAPVPVVTVRSGRATANNQPGQDESK